MACPLVPSETEFALMLLRTGKDTSDIARIFTEAGRRTSEADVYNAIMDHGKAKAA